jgi:hypothetical protein
LTSETEALRLQVARQVAHWRAAVMGLRDAENFAAAGAWRTLEQYVGTPLRRHLGEAAEDLARRADVLAAELRAATTPTELEQVRVHVIGFRRRYLQVETALDFYGDAVNSRTSPRLAALLRACDTLALRSLEWSLVPLGQRVPPVLTYVDKGLGASILRAGLRLWDGGNVSPAAAIKITRQNLYRPTALLHEAGHQAAYILGWNQELASVLERDLSGRSPEIGAAWAGWASEIAADMYAFAMTGYGSVAALHDVVSGGPTVFRHVRGDPHPIAYARVLLMVEACVRFFGAGPWDDLRQAWVRAYPLTSASADTRRLLETSNPLLARIVEICLLTPMRAFGGRPLASIIDPMRVRPDALAQLEREAGPALTTSPHWLQTECLRLLALSSYRAATEPERTTQIAAELEDWMFRLSRPLAAAA